MPVILHVFVVGFHHRKGCQVDYCYPPLERKTDSAGGVTNDLEVNLPDEWSHLPTLALPDGAHNVTKDTVYFHLPARDGQKGTVYGVSCFRQIETEKLLKKSEDVTRCSVQKSVCVLATAPLYGLIKAKLEVITAAYFNERDFERVDVLAEMYTSLAATLDDVGLVESQALMGLSARNLVLAYRHNIVLLFKLMMLERKILFHLFPVEHLCQTVLSFVSLFPGMIESGLSECAMYIPMAHLIDSLEQRSVATVKDADGSETSVISPPSSLPLTSMENHSDEDPKPDNQRQIDRESTENQLLDVSAAGDSSITEASQSCRLVLADDQTEPEPTTTPEPNPDQFRNAMFEGAETAVEEGSTQDSGRNLATTDADVWLRQNATVYMAKFAGWRSKIGESLQSLANSPTEENLGSDANLVSKSTSTPALSGDRQGSPSQDTHSISSLPTDPKDFSDDEKREVLKNYSTLVSDEWGFPLSIFTKGALCHPYLSLVHIDWLSAVNIRSYVFGATNVLFRQKKGLLDAIIFRDEESNLQTSILDAELKRQLTLTAADLRFADYLVKHVSEATGNVFVDDTEWEGSDEWIRIQFRQYLLALMATVRSNDAELTNDFNASFVRAWKSTHNYRIWACSHLPKLDEVIPGHPFHGQLSVGDVKLRFSHSMQTTDSGRKINQALNQAEKYASHTGKAVGGAFLQAKSNLSYWWTSTPATTRNNTPGDMDGTDPDASNQNQIA